MAVNNPSLSPPAQQQRTTEISSSQLTNPPTTHLAMEAPNNWLEPSMDANSTLSSQTDTRISNDDDAIARHKHYLQYHQDIFNHQQQQADADRCLDLNMSRCMSPPISCRVRSVSSPALSQSLTPRPLRVRARSCLAVQPEEEITDHIDTFDYGPRAIDEEEIALEYGARLAAARAVSIHGAARIGSGSNVSQDLGAAFDQEEEEIEIEDENDNCLSGLCIPQSRFFLTSVICSNTMTRDGLGKGGPT
ncbi:hypothetical protein BC939DRAFT_465242 [Gamsiella multidivaricata]|uniref:uncharacterized protein n=1 Tax=Gamsiella multidivaricata TaxID=101098 RepID=UPI00221E76E7|nr:uncharacterized protein BC939DRAFT_465242 [Gamsiella multidivaricata]KAI7817679.1 hypothetical protein BC939DRAFT_465242 [Gamsiella multidivaricata]